MTLKDKNLISIKITTANGKVACRDEMRRHFTSSKNSENGNLLAYGAFF